MIFQDLQLQNMGILLVGQNKVCSNQSHHIYRGEASATTGGGSGVTRNFWPGGRLKVFRQMGVAMRAWPRRKIPNLFTNLDNNK